MEKIDKYLPLFYILGAIIILNSFKKIFNGFGKSEDEKKATSDFVVSVAKKIDKSKLTYKGDSYKNIADQLYKSMNVFGTDEKRFMSNFNLIKNINDLFETINAFGVKDGKNLQDWIITEFEEVPFYPMDITISTINNRLKYEEKSTKANRKQKINFKF